MAAGLAFAVCLVVAFRFRPLPAGRVAFARPPGRAGGSPVGSFPRAGKPVAAVAGLVLVVALAGGWGVALGVMAAAVFRLARRAARRRSQQRLAAARAAALPDLVDLCRVAASASTSVWSVLHAVAPRAPAPCRPALSDLLDRRSRGESLAAGLPELAAALGPDATALTEALGRSAATGSALSPLLAEVAASVHDQRRRQAQEAARRLPVTMLFPLTLCVLPAAVVLAVAPVLVVSLRSLSS